MKPSQVVVSLLIRETCGGKAYEPEMDQLLRAIEVIGRDWSIEVVADFLEDWELGRVALRCHMAVDLKK